MERRKAHSLKYGIQKLEYATTKNPFAGRVICCHSGTIFGRKIWNSTDDRLHRVIWRRNGKYSVRGEKGCNSNHVDDQVLYRAFVDAFNTVVEHREQYMDK